MNKNVFISLLEKPDELSSENVALLNTLIKEFPYFQTAHLLYVKNLNDQNSIHYTNQLQIAAAYSTDRKILYELINKQEDHTTTYTLPREIVVDTITKTKEESVIPKEPTIIEQKEFLTEINKVSIAASEEEIKYVKIDTKKLTSVEKEIISKAIDSKIGMEVSEPVKEEKNAEKIIEKNIPQVIVEEKRIEKSDKNASYSFSDWIKLSNPNKEEKEKKKVDYSALIDKFISEDPKISKANTTFFSPADKAKEGATESTKFITETLAKIYLKQGNFKKALKAYEALSLKLPEKKAIFAAQIEKIKILIIQQK